MKKASFKPTKILLVGLLVILSLIVAVPLYILVVNIFKETKEITVNALALPRHPTFINIIKVLKSPNVNVLEMYFNTICITFFGTGICVLISSMTGYYLARIHSRTSKFLYIYYLFGLMVPYIIVIVPLVTIYKGTGIVGTLPGLILVFVSGSISFSTFVYHGFIHSIPLELEEAAFIDGSSQLKIFFRIIMPLIKPCTTTVAIFIGISMWNDFMTPLLIGQVKTITVGIYTAIGPYTADWGIVFAYILLASLPIMIAYLFAQKQFIEGLTAGALKG